MKRIKLGFWVLAFLTGGLAGLSLSSGVYGAESMELVWSTYLGASDAEYGQAITFDSSYCVYILGETWGSSFPVSSGAYDTTYNDEIDLFVTKFNAAGTALIYSTYLGGSDNEFVMSQNFAYGNGHGIAVDSSGLAYVVGSTCSTDFPITTGSYNGGVCDACVVKLNENGSALEYSIFLGGEDVDLGKAIAVDSAGYAYLTGTTFSGDFPTVSAFKDTATDVGGDAFVTQIDPDGDAFVYSTFLGADLDSDLSEPDKSPFTFGMGICIDSSGCAYATGTTFSDFPCTSGAYAEEISRVSLEDGPNGYYYGYESDAYVAKFNSGGGLVYATLLGGSDYEAGFGITVDSTGCAMLTGITYSAYYYDPGEYEEIAFPTTSGCYDDTLPNSGAGAFFTRFNPSGSAITYSSILDGEKGTDVAVDNEGHAYIVGYAGSGFPVTSGAFDTSFNGGAEDLFVVQLDPSVTGSGALVYSTYIGGSSGERGLCIAVDPAHDVYVTGYTGSSDFPTTPGSYDGSYNGESDALAVKLRSNYQISGKVIFKYPGWEESTAEVMYQVREPGLPPTEPLYQGTMSVSMAPGNPSTGDFAFSGIPDGTYDVALKHRNHIADMIENLVVSGADVTGKIFSLWAGDADGDNNPSTVYPTDANGDNDVDLKDKYTLSYQYNGALPTTTGYNADFNSDGTVDLLDYHGLSYGYTNRPDPENWYVE